MRDVRSFAPVIRPDCRLLILGSLPGAASLAAGRYYAHPRNHFWRLTGTVIEIDLEAQPYEARLETLLHTGIGLWDVVASAHRSGSLDSDLRNIAPNDLATLVVELPNLRAIAFNGAKAFAQGRPLLQSCGPELVALPSSSPANARMSWEDKLAAWESLRPHLATTLSQPTRD